MIADTVLIRPVAAVTSELPASLSTLVAWVNVTADVPVGGTILVQPLCTGMLADA